MHTYKHIVRYVDKKGVVFIVNLLIDSIEIAIMSMFAHCKYFRTGRIVYDPNDLGAKQLLQFLFSCSFPGIMS